MKILVINSRYFLSAGPEKYLFELENLLEKKGHQVVVFSVKNSQNKESEHSEYFAEPIGGSDKVYYKEYSKSPKTVYQIIERLFYSFHVKKRLKKLIKDVKPDIAYILHHYNKLSPSVIDACRENNLKVVVRLSDFFLVCPEGHLYHDGVCEKCIDDGLQCCIKNKCVKNSYLASLAKSAALKLQRILKIYDKVDTFVSPSGFTVQVVKKVLPKSNFVHIPTMITLSEKPSTKVGNYFLCVGRLEKQKGLIYAIDAVRGTDFVLKIVGSSSTGYEEELAAYAKDMKNVEFLGHKSGKELASLYKNSRAVVIPAVWYENLPNVALEAMSYSRPVIASNLGSLPFVIKDGQTGLLFEPGNIDDMREKMSLTDAKCRKLGINGYKELKKTYSPESHYKRLIEVFK